MSRKSLSDLHKVFKDFNLQSLLQGIRPLRGAPVNEGGAQAFGAMQTLTESKRHQFTVLGEYSFGEAHPEKQSLASELAQRFSKKERRRWADIADEDPVCVFYKQRYSHGVKVLLLVATKPVLAELSYDAIDHLTPEDNPGCFLVMKVSFSGWGENIRSAAIDNRGVCKALRQHKVMKCISLSLLNYVRPCMTERTNIINSAMHAATVLFMSDSDESYVANKRWVDESGMAAGTYRGPRIYREKPAFALLDFQTRRLEEQLHAGNVVQSLFFVQPRRSVSAVTRKASVSAACSCAVM